MLWKPSRMSVAYAVRFLVLYIAESMKPKVAGKKYTLYTHIQREPRNDRSH